MNGWIDSHSRGIEKVCLCREGLDPMDWLAYGIDME